MKIFLTIVMIVTGLLGLGATACGVLFISANDAYINWEIAVLIGIIPGIILLSLANWLWRSINADSRNKIQHPPKHAKVPPLDGAEK